MANTYLYIILLRSMNNFIAVTTRGLRSQARSHSLTDMSTPHWCSPGEPGMRLAQGLYSVLVLTRAPGNEASNGLVLHTGAHRSHSANIELLLFQPLERLIFQFCQIEMMSLEYHPHNHSSSTSTLYPYMVHPDKECLYTGCYNLG